MTIELLWHWEREFENPLLCAADCTYVVCNGPDWIVAWRRICILRYICSCLPVAPGHRLLVLSESCCSLSPVEGGPFLPFLLLDVLASMFWGFTIISFCKQALPCCYPLGAWLLKAAGHQKKVSSIVLPFSIKVPELQAGCRPQPFGLQTRFCSITPEYLQLLPP